MSVRRLNAAIIQLQHSQSIGEAEIALLREAAGNRVSSTERDMMSAFVGEHVEALSSEAVLALRERFDMMMPNAASLTPLAMMSLDANEASGVAMLDDERALIADDEKGLYLETAHDTRKLLSSKHDGAKGLEGLCLSEDKSTAFTLSENNREIHAIPLEDHGYRVSLGEPKSLGRLPRLGDKSNKGWEGLDVLPGRFSPDGASRLVAVHEGYPRRIGIFSLPDLETEQLFKLPRALDQEMTDLSDVAVCPATGHLFILSDQSAKIVELELTRRQTAGPGALLESHSLRVLGSFHLPKGSQGKAEGLSFSDEQTLWVTSEEDQNLLQIRVTRS